MAGSGGANQIGAIKTFHSEDPLRADNAAPIAAPIAIPTPMPTAMLSMATPRAEPRATPSATPRPTMLPESDRPDFLGASGGCPWFSSGLIMISFACPFIFCTLSCSVQPTVASALFVPIDPRSRTHELCDGDVSREDVQCLALVARSHSHGSDADQCQALFVLNGSHIVDTMRSARSIQDELISTPHPGPSGIMTWPSTTCMCGR